MRHTAGVVGSLPGDRSHEASNEKRPTGPPPLTRASLAPGSSVVRRAMRRPRVSVLRACQTPPCPGSAPLPGLSTAAQFWAAMSCAQRR